MGLVVELSFVNVSNGASYAFAPNANCRVQKYDPAYTGRVVDRPRMQEHGANPTVPYIDKLPIHLEGLLLADSTEQLISERNDFLRAMLGNLTRRKTQAKSGTLTIQLDGWSDAADVDVAVESAEAPLEKDGVRTCNFQVTVIAFQPYALSDDVVFYL
jgi:hypothetical protein